MEVINEIKWKVKHYCVANFGNVEAAGGDVSADEDLGVSSDFRFGDGGPSCPEYQVQCQASPCTLLYTCRRRRSAGG